MHQLRQYPDAADIQLHSSETGIGFAKPRMADDKKKKQDWTTTVTVWSLRKDG